MVNKIISNVGTIFVPNANLGVFSDAACTIAITSLSWGALEPSTVNNKQFYVKNLGNVPLLLTSSSSGWTPTNGPTYLHLTWDRESTVLSSNTSVLSTLTLTVDANITGITSFGFNLTIDGVRQ